MAKGQSFARWLGREREHPRPPRFDEETRLGLLEEACLGIDPVLISRIQVLNSGVTAVLTNGTSFRLGLW